MVCLILAVHEWKCGCRCDSTCRRTKIKRIIAYPFVCFSVSLPAQPPALCFGTLMVQKPSSGNPTVHRIMLRQLCIKNSLGMQRCKTCAWDLTILRNSLSPSPQYSYPYLYKRRLEQMWTCLHAQISEFLGLWLLRQIELKLLNNIMDGSSVTRSEIKLPN